jgi:hypothetical protein
MVSEGQFKEAVYYTVVSIGVFILPKSSWRIFLDTTYARRSDGQLIEAKRGIDKHLSFYCPGCEHEVYAATEGKKQRPHFRHKSLNGHTGCTEPESYVHWITKELFAEQYQNLDVFDLSIEIEKRCVHDHECIQEEMHKLNLKEKYPYIKVEKHHNGFRPDCLLYNDNGDKLYFEAHYTSGISEAKRASGIPIIEVKVFNEENIDEIINKGGFTTQKKQSFHSRNKYYSVEVHNKETLVPKEVYSFDCKKNCLMKTPTILQPPKRNTMRRTGYRPPQRNNPPYPNALYKGELPYGIISQNKTLPDQNQGAIEYLSRNTGKYDRYSIKTVMPQVLTQAIESYNKSHKQFRNMHSVDSMLEILIDENTFMFIKYDGMFFGALRYEAKWHIFSITDQKINFVESVSEHKEVSRTIKQCSELF